MIEWRSLSFSYGDMTVLDDFSLTLEGTGITVLLGPSGCGKTTLLHLAAGLRIPQKGEAINPFRQTQSYLFQKSRLLPWKNIRDNVAFALSGTLQKEERDRRTLETLKLVGLEDFAGYFPRELSGGMEQRAAIARAFAPEAELLFMDEPFKGLDLKMKIPLIKLILSILEQRKTRTILVTHDVREAILMGDRIILLQGPPLSIREHFMNPCHPENRSMEHQAFYSLEHHLYSLILE